MTSPAASTSPERHALLHILITLTLVGFGGLAYPFVGPTRSLILAGLIVGLNVWIWRSPAGWPFRLAHALAAPPPLRKVLLATLPVVILFGWLEAFCQTATKNDWIPYSVPMITMLPPGQEDFRLAHITADEYREPDPVLLWRPMPVPPYNSHRFKGPEPATPKASRTFRIITYGDSNTDGPDVGGWPERLQDALNAIEPSSGREFEVLNAGVTGYSSYQGLRRFEMQAARYDPDLVLVSFGWNDAAPATGEPDRSFEPPPPAVVFLLRTVLRYRSFLVARAVVDQFRRDDVSSSSGPRVPVEDYGRNLRSFIKIALSVGAKTALLTRPHTTPEGGFETGSWRAAVPTYNAELVRTAATTDVPGIDVCACSTVASISSATRRISTVKATRRSASSSRKSCWTSASSTSKPARLRGGESGRVEDARAASTVLRARSSAVLPPPARNTPPGAGGGPGAYTRT